MLLRAKNEKNLVHITSAQICIKSDNLLQCWFHEETQAQEHFTISKWQLINQHELMIHSTLYGFIAHSSKQLDLHCSIQAYLHPNRPHSSLCSL